MSNPRNPTSRSADVSGFTFLSPNVLPDKYFTKKRHMVIHTRLVPADAVTDVEPANLKINFETKLIR